MNETWKYGCPNGHTAYRSRSYFIYCPICRENDNDQFRFVQKLNRKTGKLENVQGKPSVNIGREIEEIQMVEK